MMFFAFASGMILSNLINIQSLEKVSKDEQEILFIYRGIEKTLTEIRESDRDKISLLNQQKVSLIESAALHQYFLDEAKKQNLDVEEVAQRLLKWKPVTSEEVNSFYELNKHKLNKQFYEVEKYIKQNLEQRKAREARRNLLKELISSGDLAILPRD